MDYNFYLDIFQKSADKLDKKLLKRKLLEVGVGVVLDSVFIKLYKRGWTNDTTDPMNAKTRIFFSIWINDKTIKENKIFYNIHALKLRQLRGYSISSKQFAQRFRAAFEHYQDDWKNVSVKFGPLTLMEGWEALNEKDLENTLIRITRSFLKIDHLIDEILDSFKNH
ncbi:MAG TPA: hypothetical protein PKC72_08230 [Chitinophagaceae bacterium]|nr:hypothetical protein [Chitinophagaceae bacterium]